MSAIVFLSPDLMFTSRLVGAAQTLGTSLAVAANAAQLAQKLTADCRLVIVDLTMGQLDLPGIISATKKVAPGAQVIAFGAHVDEAALAAAEAAGCDLVLSRGQFHKQYVELLRGTAQH